MRELDVVLSYLTGRRLTSREIYTTLGIPKATFYAQRDEGRLISAPSLIKIARAFHVNPVVLLVEYGHITADDVARYTEESHPPQSIPVPDHIVTVDSLAPGYIVTGDSQLLIADPNEAVVEADEVLAAPHHATTRVRNDDVVAQRPRKERSTAEVEPQRIVLEIPASLGQTAVSATDLAAAIKQALDASFKELAKGQTAKTS